MSNVVFVSNNVAHWNGAVTTTLVNSFDPDAVPYAMQLSRHGRASSPDFTPVTGDVTWVHFRTWFVEDNDYAESEILIDAYDENGNILFKVYNPVTSGSFFPKVKLYYDGTSYNETQFIGPMIAITTCIMDFKYTATASSLELKIYVNGGLVFTATKNSNVDSRSGVAAFTIGAIFVLPNASGKFEFSEILVADIDTRNARVNMLRPTGDGFSTDWIGASGDLADDDPTSGITTRLTEQDQTMDMTTYNGSDNISKVIVTSLANAGENAPQNMKHILRRGGTTYEHADLVPLTDSTKYALSSFDLNPTTSDPWVAADIVDMEMGMRSKT